MLCPVKWLNGECMEDVRVLGIRLWDTLTLMHCYTLRHKISKIFKNVRYKETFYNIYKKDFKLKVLMSTLCVLLGCFTSSSPDIIIV